MKTIDQKAFEELKRKSALQLLFKCARLVNEQAIARLNAGQNPGNAPPLRAAHTALFPHLSSEGIRGADLAKKLGVTKQAVSQLIMELEWWGVVEQVADPRDGRAKLVRLTAKGEQGLLQGLSVLSELEQELADKIGKRRMQELRAALLALEKTLL